MWRRLAAIALVLSFGGGHSSPAAAQEEPYGGLPPGDGRETVYAICSGCHSIKLVQQQGMSRSRWDHLLDWMVEKQGMPELDPETRTIVLDYLAQHFGEKSRQDGLSPFNQPQPLMPAE
ncbi:MAG: hypothetical protein R3316_00805 [Rhodovibrionaceae bacterium]|nr:hypothetical protein [Rhodovibrionaceae bacterium]